jgi:hypothetical protein
MTFGWLLADTKKQFSQIRYMRLFSYGPRKQFEAAMTLNTPLRAFNRIFYILAFSQEKKSRLDPKKG